MFLVFLQANLGEWLSAIGLSQYHQVLVQNGYENIDFITDITWEDLQEIGITKLGKSDSLFHTLYTLMHFLQLEHFESYSILFEALESTAVKLQLNGQ